MGVGEGVWGRGENCFSRTPLRKAQFVRNSWGSDVCPGGNTVLRYRVTPPEKRSVQLGHENRSVQLGHVQLGHENRSVQLGQTVRRKAGREGNINSFGGGRSEPLK